MLKKIIAYILFFFSFLSFLVFFLFNGINVNSFSFGNFNISQLYIKMDKKLIVTIEEITVSRKSEVKNSMEDVKAIISKVPTILQFFQKIDIESLNIDDNNFKILFDNDHIYLNNKYINFSSKYEVIDDIMNLTLYSLQLKDIDLLLFGKIKLDYKHDMANFFGSYIYKDHVYGEIHTQLDNKYIDFFINAQETEDIKFLKDFMTLDSIAESWMYDNIKGLMSLEHLYGKIKIDTMEPELDSIKGYARIKNASVKFHKKLDAIQTSSLSLVYENDTLNIKLIDPIYQGVKIDGSHVSITNMTSKEKGQVNVNIHAKHHLDEKIHTLLDAYKIKIPLDQIDGTTDTKIELKIPYDGPMKTFGTFKIKDSNFMLDNFPFYSKKALVELNQSDVILKNADFKHKEILQSKLNFTINTKTLQAKGKALLELFEIKSKDNSSIVKVQNKTTPITLNFKDTASLYLETFDTSLVFAKEATKISIPKLEKIYPYSELLKDIEVKKGDLKLDIIDNTHIKLEANFYDLKLPLQKNEKFITSLQLSGSIIDDMVSISTPSKDLRIDIENNDIHILLNNYDVVYKSSEKREHIRDLKIRLVDSNIAIDNKEKVYSIASNISILKDKVLFDGEFGSLDIPLSKDGKHITQLDLVGSYENEVLNVHSKDNRIKIKIVDENNLIVDLNDIDLRYDTGDKETSYKSLKAKAVNSKIIINNKFVVLADDYQFFSSADATDFELNYQKAKVIYSQNMNKEVEISAKGINDTFVNTFFDKDIVKGGTFIVSARGIKDVIEGKMFFNKNKIKNLAVLNNIITLVNTSPALINPLLAIPAVFGMVTEKGFDLNGYKVNDGFVDFMYNSKNQFLNLTKIKTTGNSVDFEGYATLDFKNSLVDSKMDLIFMKDYSKVVNVIPGLDYILLGDDKKVSTSITITGMLDQPKIESHIAKDSISVPIDILKRIITAPLKIFGK